MKNKAYSIGNSPANDGTTIVLYLDGDTNSGKVVTQANIGNTNVQWGVVSYENNKVNINSPIVMGTYVNMQQNDDDNEIELSPSRYTNTESHTQKAWTAILDKYQGKEIL